MFRLQRLHEIKNKFLMVRHGESIWNQDSKFTGWTNIPLTTNGRLEAHNIGKTLLKNNIYTNIIFTSVLNRAIETSNIIKYEFNDIKDMNILSPYQKTRELNTIKKNLDFDNED